MVLRFTERLNMAGSVATDLMCAEIFHNHFITNVPTSLAVKEF